MKHTHNSCLYDIHQNIVEIEEFTRLCKTFEQFRQNILVKKTIERNITIIGEALKRTLAFEPAIAISNARQIPAMRNIIVHEYEKIDDEVLYAAVTKHLAVLKQEVEQLLADSNL